MMEVGEKSMRVVQTAKRIYAARHRFLTNKGQMSHSFEWRAMVPLKLPTRSKSHVIVMRGADVALLAASALEYKLFHLLRLFEALHRSTAVCGRMKILSPALASLLFHACTSYAYSPPIVVELRSSWPAPPLILEAMYVVSFCMSHCVEQHTFSESIALEDPDAFFLLLDTITNPEVFPLSHPNTPEQTHSFALEIAVSEGCLTEPGAYASAEMNLALHAASPKIEAFYQYYNDHHSPATADCDSWVDWYGQVICDAETLSRVIRVETIEPPHLTGGNSSFVRRNLLPFDHIRPSPDHLLQSPPRTAVLYASLYSNNFRELHSYLYDASSGPSPHIEYVFRPIPSRDQDVSKTAYLSGYGVALDLKKMDYLALDDRGRSAGVEDGRTPRYVFPFFLWYYLLRSLRKERHMMLVLTSLGLSPGQAMELLTHPAISSTQSESGVLDGRFDASDRPEEGDVIVWLNDFEKDERSCDSFCTNLDLLASYARWGGSIKLLLRPLYPGQFPSIKLNLFNVILAVDLSQSSSLNFIAVTVSNLIERNFPFRWGVVPLVETDEGAILINGCKNGATNLLLEQALRSDKNDVVYQSSTSEWIIEEMSKLSYYQISQANIPVHFVKPTVDWSLVRSEFIALLTSNDPLDEGVATDLDFVLEGVDGDLDKARLYTARLGTTLESAPQGHVFFNGRHFDLNDDFLRSMQMEVGQQMQHLQKQVRIPSLLSVITFRPVYLQLHQGKLGDSDVENISTYFYDLPFSFKRRNIYIHTSANAGNIRIFSLTDLIGRNGLNSFPGSFVYPLDSDRTPLTTYIVADFDTEEGLQFVKTSLASAVRFVTPGSLTRFSFIHNPTAVPSSFPGRLSSPAALLAHLISKDILYKVSPSRLMGILGLNVAVVQNQSPQIIISPEGSLDDILGDTFVDGESSKLFEDYLMSCLLIVKDLQLHPGEQAVVVNGRVAGPMHPGEFVSDDFKMLATYEYHKRVKPVEEALEEIVELFRDLDRGASAELVAMTSSIVSSIQMPDPSEVGLFNAPYRPRLRNYQLLDGEYTYVSLPSRTYHTLTTILSGFTFGDNATAFYHFGVLLDPLSEFAQRWSSLMEWLLNIPGVFVELHVNPPRYREVPLKRFYRYNLLPKLSFDEQGEEVRAKTEFTGLPTEPIYTLAMDVPSSWLVRPRESFYDLDNIQLGTLSSQDREQGVRAVFDLDYLVIEGHARDNFTGNPPRGVQLQLVMSNGTPIADTQVVANLGYLQFRTKPGVFQLEIRPGRGRDIFEMESVGNEGWDSATVDDVGNEITLTSFEGLTLYPRLAKLPGMKGADVLADDSNVNDDSNGLLGDIMSRFVLIPIMRNSMSSFFHFKETEEKAVAISGDGQADINIFTVASGLLYERFASIMILSVLRNTNSSVKFWFIENFLSPSFLVCFDHSSCMIGLTFCLQEFIPHFAQAYGFDYELVTYKWPSWLRAQKEKPTYYLGLQDPLPRRSVPMDLKKIIFVDADQIVRADLKELVDLDLHGAPYGYTPMGDDNTEMEGFRFWKTGYWKDFLQGLPYHIRYSRYECSLHNLSHFVISALYVVDLVRFRKDILRGHYQQLSADPNSLANLDQGGSTFSYRIRTFLIDVDVDFQTTYSEKPIFSLPETGLGSKDRLHRAKTIDLCQNPLTKEPKLARARQIPEWEVYDSEIANFARKLAVEGRIRSEVVAVDVNILADVGAGRSTAISESEVGVVEQDTVLGTEGDRQRDEL
ncbi:UDP-glucose:glycoprotein glucosyltransferase, partial [Grifola frondosa]